MGGRRRGRVWPGCGRVWRKKGASKGRSTVFPSRAALVLELRWAGAVFAAWLYRRRWSCSTSRVHGGGNLRQTGLGNTRIKAKHSKRSLYVHGEIVANFSKPTQTVQYLLKYRNTLELHKKHQEQETKIKSIQ